MDVTEHCACGKPLTDCEQRIAAVIRERDEIARDRDSAVAGWGEAERQRQGAVEAVREALDLLDNARSDFGDPTLKRRWAARRKALRDKWGES